ncbi:unnamed protein product, partial [marine sediment metagenome]
NVVVVEKALDEKKGQAEMMICDSHSLSSLSKDWIEKVRKSGRYADCDWQGKVTVETETLDDLIATYGKPAFVKVDVEGYEEEVIQGLSQPVNYMCFEFTPEFIESAIGGVRHLARLGKVVFNYCSGTHPFKLALHRWVDAEQICSILEAAIGISDNVSFCIFANSEDTSCSSDRLRNQSSHIYSIQERISIQLAVEVDQIMNDHIRTAA